LGTFEDLDGEMAIVDGHFFQVRSDGTVREVGDSILTPFAVITAFASESAVLLESCPDLAHLTSRFDVLRNSDNVFFALRVDGKFECVHTRAMRRTNEGVPLVQAAAVQPEFEFHDVVGTLVGFWTPEYAKTFNVPGYHLHFITEDRGAGGHMMECSGTDLRVQLSEVYDLRVALPENQEFLRADLTRDPSADLDQAEHVRNNDKTR